jgi:xanthomonalisin
MALFALLLTVPALAQSDAASAVLSGHTPPQVLDGSAVRVSHYNLDRKLRLVLAIQPPQTAEEEQFLTELQTKGSPNSHQFLTTEEWNARFAPSAEDEQKVVDWAQSQGLTVTNR